MRKLLVAASLFALAFGPAQLFAAEVYVDETQLQDVAFGLVCGSKTAKSIPAPDTELGSLKIREEWQQIVRATRTIPMVDGLGFGVDVRPQSPRQLNNVKITLIHPPYANTGVTKESWNADLAPAKSNLNFFVFEFPFEMVTGEWTLEARKWGKKLFSVPFNVVTADDTLDISNLCSGSAVVS